MDTIGTAAGFVFTLLIFSYILGDNFLYRIAVYVFIGLAAAYTTIVTVESVILPLINTTNPEESFFNTLLLMTAFILTILLFFRRSERLSFLSNIPIAFLVAVGTSLAIIGAITGTLFPFVLGSGDTANGIPEAIIMFIGVASSLIYFQYHAQERPDGTIRRSRMVESIALLGKGFIAITLGALYGTAILTSLTILTGRISFLLAGGA